MKNDSNEKTNALGLLLGRARYEGGKSQEYMALELGVAKKTVQNWEKGVSCPDLDQAIEWFRVLNLSALPYLFQYIFPDLENIKANDDDKKLRRALQSLIANMPMEGVRQLLYLFYGDHGSSPRAILQMINAHLQSPMRDRLSHGSMIALDYELAARKEELTSREHIQPDMDLLYRALRAGEDSVIRDVCSYSLAGEKRLPPAEPKKMFGVNSEEKKGIY